MKVLTVCLGNICRSPAAQGILEYVASEKNVDITVDSAGTAAYHIGKQPDTRSIKALADIDINIRGQRARQVSVADFDAFDWIVAMDAENLANLKRIAPENCRANLVMFGRYRPEVDFGEVADPYYGGDEGFATMRDQLKKIAEDFVQHLRERA